MDRQKFRINLKLGQTEDSYLNSSSSSSLKESTISRSRSRLPHKERISQSSSPRKERTGFITSDSGLNSLSTPLTPNNKAYRERSPERSAEKLHKSSLYHKDITLAQDLPLLNTSANNIIKNPEFQDEQNSRGRSRSRDGSQIGSNVINVNDNKIVEEGEDEDEDDNSMISLMGFSGFGSTKGKHVKAAKGGAIKQEKKTEYRQYMNRSKGFNRPLSPGR